MKTAQLSGSLRTNVGKKDAAAVRNAGMVPCVLYGQGEQTHFAVKRNDIEKIFFSPDVFQIHLDIEGKKANSIIRELQRHPMKDNILHVDFLELVEDKKVIVTLPLKFTGAPVGVKAGGKLVTKIKSLKVKLLPKYLRENIELDITNLELNENIRVQDVKADNMEIMNSPRIPIASITMTRQLKQEEAAAPKAAAAKAAPAAAAAPKK